MNIKIQMDKRREYKGTKKRCKKCEKKKRSWILAFFALFFLFLALMIYNSCGKEPFSSNLISFEEKSSQLPTEDDVYPVIQSFFVGEILGRRERKEIDVVLIVDTMDSTSHISYESSFDGFFDLLSSFDFRVAVTFIGAGTKGTKGIKQCPPQSTPTDCEQDPLPQVSERQFMLLTLDKGGLTEYLTFSLSSDLDELLQPNLLHLKKKALKQAREITKDSSLVAVVSGLFKHHQDFFRDEASLFLILLSNTDDESLDRGQRENIRRTFIQNLEGYPQSKHLMFNGLLKLKNNESCENPSFKGDIGINYANLIRSMGGAVFSICSEDYNSNFQNTLKVLNESSLLKKQKEILLRCPPVLQSSTQSQEIREAMEGEESFGEKTQNGDEETDSKNLIHILYKSEIEGQTESSFIPQPTPYRINKLLLSFGETLQKGEYKLMYFCSSSTPSEAFQDSS